MSKEIDERVVEMRFDNKQFEENTATTLSTLKKLKNALDFSNIGKSFQNINKASENVDLSGIDKSISGIKSKFSALEVMAITTLGNITNSFVNSAKRWVSSFTIEPIRSGFQEYETQINAVQTILANTQKEGTNIKDVNAALDELNYYADKTIYNFTEMTRNIGTFTAAGVDLKTSVDAIQGIANLAAVSGSNSQQASTAMYQLSQALATGTIRLMDWNSVVNAGMGGQLFQDALKETSRLLGTGVDAAIEAEGSFRESLKTGWLTSEVLTETLKKFTTSGAAEYVAKYTGLSKEAIESELELAKSTYGEADAIDKAAESLAKKSGKNKDEIAQTLKFAQTAEDAATKVKTFSQLIDTLKEAVQSGWSQSFRIIIGDFEEAKELFTEISDSFSAVIGASADARNKLLSEVFNKKDAEDYISSVVSVPKEAIEELQKIAKEAGTTSDAFKNTLSTFTNGDETLDKVTTHMINMVSSEKDVISYISDITGMQEESIEELQKVGKEVGYTSDEFKDFADVLSEGDPEMQSTITHLLKMSEAVQKPSGRELLIDSLRNGMKGLISVIKPVQEAFNEVFPPITADRVYGILESIHELTKELTLNEKNSEDLRKAFKGLFDVSKLLGDGFLSLIKLIIPIEKPVGTLSDGILGLSGSVGDLLSKFSKWARSSKTISKAFSYLQKGSSDLMDDLSSLIKIVIDFTGGLSKMKGSIKFIDSVTNAFERLYKKAGPYIDDFISDAGELLDSLFNFEDVNVDDALKVVSDALEYLALKIDNISFETLEQALDIVRSKIKELSNISISNDGLSTFIENFKKYGEELKGAFEIDNLLNRLEKIMDIFGKFFNWIRNTMRPAFEDFNVGSAVAASGGLGLIYAIIKIAKSFENVTKSITSIPEVLDSVKGTLVAYQKQLKAEALVKVATGIAILAGALVILSFADTDRILQASIALGIIGGLLIFGVSKFLEATDKGKELNNSLQILSKGLSSTMKKFGRAIEIKAIGDAVKKFAESIAIIAVSIVALGVMYNKDKNAFAAGVEIVKNITIALLVIMGGMSILGSILKGGMKGFSQAALGILSLSLALTLCISTLNKLFKMEFPSDWENKTNLLKNMLIGIGALALILGIASKISGRDVKSISGPILSMAVLLISVVYSLDKLFKMELPSDWESKVDLLKGIFIGIGALLLVLGITSKIAGGSIKAAGTILSISLFLGVIIGSLYVLTLIPGEKMLKGAISLGLVLTALGTALYGAGKISIQDTYKSILAMAAVIGTITVSLSLLSIIPFQKLLKGSVFLGSILLILAQDFKQVSKITNEKAWMSILAMVGVIASITAALYILSEQPWEGLLSSAASLGTVLLSVAKTLKMISSMSGLKKEKILLFLAATLSFIPIGVALGVLSRQPWEGLLSSAASMSVVLLAFAETMKTVSNLRGLKKEKILLFLAATLSFIPIGVALYKLADQPWEGLLAAGTALSEVLLVFSLSFSIISSTKPDLKAIGLFLSASVSTALIAYALYKLADQPWEGLLAAGTALSEVLLAMSAAMGICTIAGGFAGAAIAGIGLLDLFLANMLLVLSGLGFIFKSEEAKALISGGAGVLIEIGNAIGGFVGAIVNNVLTSITSSLPQMATDLSNFMINLAPFITGSKLLDADSLTCVGYLAGIIIALTAAEVINGITSLFGMSLVDVAIELSNFMISLVPFISLSRNLKEDSVRACGYLADMVIKLTAAQFLSGVANFLGFGSSLSTLGDELTKFGYSIVDFADTVKDVKPEAVKGAAAAAEIMANLANKLPAQDGLAQKIFGERSLADFGAELVLFGPSLVAFAFMVKDVKPEAVKGAAAAAEIMANLANKLPAQDGLAQKIFGERSLADFGAELVLFGPSLVAFAFMVKDVKPEALNGCRMATSIMTNLANNLPNSETLWSKIFGGGQMSLSSFGEELVKFGESMGDFSEKLINVDSEKINGVISSFRSLVDLAIYTQNATPDTIINFSNKLSEIGTDSIEKFVSAFTDAGPRVSSSINSLFTVMSTTLSVSSLPMLGTATLIGGNLSSSIHNGILSKQQSIIDTEFALTTLMTKTIKNNLPEDFFNKTGKNIMQALLDGIKSKERILNATIKNICIVSINQFKTSLPSLTFSLIGQNIIQSIINGINIKRPTMLLTISAFCITIANAFKANLSSDKFNGIGSGIISGLIDGINSNNTTSDSAIKTLCDNVINAFKTNLAKSKFETIGKNAAIGLKEGIESKIKEVSDAAIAAAKAAVQAAKDELKEKSPSKVFFEMGEFIDLGLANGMIAYLRVVSKAAVQAADESIEPVSEAIGNISSIINSDGMNLDPVIRPVLDLAEVRRGANEISSLMNQKFDLSSEYFNAMRTASTFSGNKNLSEEIGPSNSKSVEGDHYEFNQYNYSPKALSRSEIYRDTSNQFSTFKKAVKIK